MEGDNSTTTVEEQGPMCEMDRGNRSRRTEANKGGVERLMRDGYRVPVYEEDSCNSSRGTEAIWEGDRDHWRRGTVATALEKQRPI